MSRQARRKIEMQRYREEKKARRKAQAQLKEKQKAEGFNQGEPKKTRSNAKSSFKTVTEERDLDQERAITYLKIMQKLLPDLLDKLSKVEDFRDPKKIKHKKNILLLFGILCFVFQKSSRREANREMTTAIFLANMQKFFPEMESLPHQDTLNRFLSGIDINEIEQIVVDFIRDFIKSKKFLKYLIHNCYPIAIDGTQKYTYKFLWAEECQRRTINDKEQYYCYVLEASLVFHNGIILPVATEILDYMEGDTTSDKQDCETKAFKRLAKKLKNFFPRLKIMILLDGLYPNGPIMEVCRDYGWEYMISLPDNILKSVWEEYDSLKDFEENNRKEQKWGNRRQNFIWVNDICYVYGKNKEQAVHVVVCREEWEEISIDGSIEIKTRKFAWISSEPLSRYNVHERCNLGARYRWGIETGFLVEKKYGYQYEHTFSFNWNAMKGYHLLMRIAHMINNLVQYSNLLKYLFVEKGMMAAIKYLDEIFRKVVLDCNLIKDTLAQHCQIRFG